MGKFSIKGVFNNLFRPEKWGDSYFYGVNGTTDKDHTALANFKEIPELNAALNWKANAFSNMKLKVVDANGVEIENDISKLLKQPNPNQDQKEFLKQTKLFHDIFGDEFVYFLSPAGMPDRTKAINTLPPQHVKVKDISKIPYWLKTDQEGIVYSIEWAGKEMPLDKNFIMHLNDNRVDISAEDYLTGTTKTESLKDPLDNIRAAYNARGSSLTNQGPQGIISSAARDGMGSLPLMPEDIEDIQGKLSKMYGVLKGMWRYIVSSKAIQFTPITSDLDKLKTFEEVEADFDKVLDAYGLTRDIFSDAKGSTFENKKEAEKQAYQDTIIPEANVWVGGLNKYFNTEEKSYTITGTFDHLPILQSDKNEEANTVNTITSALSTAFTDGAITLDQYTDVLTNYYEEVGN